MIGEVVGDFEIVRELGRGGMGAVYEGRDRMLGRRVAIKMVHPELARDPVLGERFRKEAQALAQLNHPNVTSVYSLFRHGERLYLVMEYIEGESLDARLRGQGALPWRQAVELACGTLDGLQHAHQHGILHRDIKPANLYLPTAGGIKIMDFGIAHILGQERLTRMGTVVGTLAYMSPEQVGGRDIDARTDLYSMGIVLYEMVTGRLPFRADSDFELMRAQLEKEPEPPRALAPTLPLWLEAAIVRALAKDPDERFATAAELAAELREVGARAEAPGAVSEDAPTRVIGAPPPPTVVAAPPPTVVAAPSIASPPPIAGTPATPARRPPLIPLATAGLLAVAAIVFVLALAQDDEVDDAPPPVAEPVAEVPVTREPPPVRSTPPPVALRQSPPVAPSPPPARTSPPARTPPPPVAPPRIQAPPPPAEPPPPPPPPEPPPPAEPVVATALDHDELLLEVGAVAGRLKPASERLLDHYDDYRDEIEDDDARAKPEDEGLENQLEAFAEAAERLRRAYNVTAERQGVSRKRGIRKFATKMRSKVSSADEDTMWARADEVLQTGRRVADLLRRANSDDLTRSLWREIQRDLTRLERLVAQNDA